jgi:UDP-glucose 4-epimerase
MDKVIVTGCAGFIGSNLVDHLLKKGKQVQGIDNFKTGRIEFLDEAFSNPNFKFKNVDLFTNNSLVDSFQGYEILYHFAANADIRFGYQNPRKDLEQNTIVTHNVLEAARLAGINKIVFASTGSIYGESKIIPTPENSPFPIQTSLYGASKLAAEGLIQAYSETFGIQAWIFRFVSILGPRYSHGHVYDFYKQLLVNPKLLKVLGDGSQRKSYLHVDDCLKGIDIGIDKSDEKINIFNLGIDGTCSIKDSINWITKSLRINPRIEFEKKDRGWVGDNPHIHLDIGKLSKLGWQPKNSIEQSVVDTVKFLEKNHWLH